MADDTPAFVAGLSRKKFMIITGTSVAIVLLINIIVVIAVYSSNDSGSEVGEVKSRDKCESGRYYVGDVNGAFPEYAVATGIYVETPKRTRWAQIYKHESRDFYLAKKVRQYWRVYKNRTFGMEVKTQANRPDGTRMRWRVRYGKDDDRAYMDNLKAVCVEPSFVTCHSGKIRVSGLEMRTGASLRSFMGNYSLMNRLHNGRQVYRQENGKGYLFYTGLIFERWCIDYAPPFSGNLTGFMFTEYSSSAIRPEYVINKSWVAFDIGPPWDAFGRQPVRVTCVDSGRPSVLKMEPDIAVKRDAHLPFFYFGNIFCRAKTGNKLCSHHKCCA